MFWKKRPATGEPSQPKVEKLPGLKGMPAPVGMHLVVALKQNPDWVWQLKSLVRPRPESKDAFDFRVFSSAKVAAREVTVKDYTSLDEHPDLILYEGWFNKRTHQVEIGKQAS